jgi:putative RNA 2'-phosphotransferase
MNSKDTVRISKFLSLILRHEPERVGLKLDSAGWVAVTDLLRALNGHGLPLTFEQLKDVVETNDKRRFAFSEDGESIRASQGHSVDVDLEYEPTIPPEILYHGTPGRFVDSIRRSGLQKGERHHVHLSPDPETTIKVGQRRGRPVVLKVRAGEMHQKGHTFCRSANNVWLVEHVPAEFIDLYDGNK